MANELSITLSVSYSKGGITISKDAGGPSVTISGSYPVALVQNIGTTDESLVLGGDIGTPGFLFAHNMDATNYITLGGDGTNYFNKLKPGEYMLVRWNGAAVHAKANTAACDLEYALFPD